VIRSYSQIFISSFHIQANSTSQFNKEVNFNSEAWIVKVICSLIVFRDFSCLEYFEKNLNSSISFEVIRRLKDPKLGLKFFDYSRMKCERIEHLGSTYNLLVRGLCQIGLHDSALNVIFDGHLPDSSILDFLVTSCAQVGKLDIVKAVIVRAYKSKIRVNSYTYNSLLNILIKRNRVDEAVCFFREQHLRFGFCADTWSFNIVIRGLCRIREVDRAFEFFNDMESFGCSPDIVTYNTLINGLFRVNEVDRGQELLNKLKSNTRLKPDVVTYTSAISGYCKLGKMEDASILFDEMVHLGINPNSFTYNVLIDGFGKNADICSAAAIYEKMLLKGCPPDVVTLSSLIDGYCRIGDVDEAMKLWHDMGTRKISPNAYTFSILICAFCKENRLNEARDLLRQLKWTDVISQPFMYNPVIDGFCKAGNVDEANVILMEMEQNRCNPDKLTYTILIIGHCMKGRMSEAISIFNKMLTSGCVPDDITVHSLRSRLLKAGMPHEAHQLLLTLSEKKLNLNPTSSGNVHSLRNNLDVRVAV
ncbi:hypothetical protein AQUCO_03700224v1, partial [Aquilegia coerulea]